MVQRMSRASGTIQETELLVGQWRKRSSVGRDTRQQMTLKDQPREEKRVRERSGSSGWAGEEEATKGFEKKQSQRREGWWPQDQGQRAEG